MPAEKKMTVGDILYLVVGILVILAVLGYGLGSSIKHTQQEKAKFRQWIQEEEAAYLEAISSDTGSVEAMQIIHAITYQLRQYKTGKYLRFPFDSARAMVQADSALDRWIAYKHDWFRREAKYMDAQVLYNTYKNFEYMFRSFGVPEDWWIQPLSCKNINDLCPYDTFRKLYRDQLLQETRAMCHGRSAANWPYHDQEIKEKLEKCYREVYCHDYDGHIDWEDFLDTFWT